MNNFIPEFRVFENNEMVCCEPSSIAFFSKEQIENDLMFYANRDDKNNQKIFQKDIVKFHDNYTGCDHVGYVDFQDSSFVIKNSTTSFYRWMDYELEIVGNMVQHPDLLEELEEQIDNSLK